MDPTAALPPPLTARDVFRILRRRAWLAFVTFASVCALTLYFTSKMPRVYSAMSRVNVKAQTTPVAPASVAEMLMGAGGNPLEVEVEKMSSWSFLSRVAARSGDKTLTPELVKGMMRVAPGPGAQILDISVKATEPRAAQKIANIAADEYIKLVNREYDEGVDQQQKRLRDARDKAYAEKRETEAKLNAFLREVGITDPALLYSSEASKTVATRGTLADLKRALPLQKSNLADLQAQLKRTDPEVYSNVLVKTPIIDRYKNEITELKVQRKSLLENFQEESPEVQEVDEKIRTRSQVVAEAERSPFSKSQRSVSRNPEYIGLQTRIRDLTLAIAASEREIESQERRGRELEAAQKRFTVEQNRYESLRNQREGATQMYEKARAGLVGIAITRSASAPSLRMLEYARLPNNPVSPKPGLNLIMAIALGLMLGVGVALIAEYASSGTMLDNDALSASLPQIGGVPLLGVLPLALPAPGSYGSELPVPLSARVGASLAEDVLREIGFTLAHRSGKEPVPVVLLSGTRSDDTTAAVAAQLAATLVRDGVRVTLVDADRAMPRLNRAFGAPDAPGLADVLAGRSLVRDILHVGAGGNLRFLAAGSPGDAQPLTEDGLKRAFKQLADGRDTDIVIVSGPSVWQVPLVGPLEKAAGGLVLLTPSGDGVLGASPSDSVARARRLLSNGYKPRLRGVIIGLDDEGSESAPVAAMPDSQPAALPQGNHPRA